MKNENFVLEFSWLIHRSFLIKQSACNSLPRRAVLLMYMFALDHTSFKADKKKSPPSSFASEFHCPDTAVKLDFCSFQNLAELRQINKLKRMEGLARTMRQPCFSHSTGCASPCSAEPCGLAVTAPSGKPAFRRHLPPYFCLWDMQR